MTAGDVLSITVVGDKASGQLLFRIVGTNIASSETAPLILDIDSDAKRDSADKAIKDQFEAYSDIIRLKAVE